MWFTVSYETGLIHLAHLLHVMSLPLMSSIDNYDRQTQLEIMNDIRQKLIHEIRI